MGLFSRLTGKRKPEIKTTTGDCVTEKSGYRSVQVNPDYSSCCDAARAIDGKRFLAEEAPMLPLSDCDAAKCKCSYRRFSDRRTDSRRTSDLAFDIVGQFHKDDRRSRNSAGRRRKD